VEIAIEKQDGRVPVCRLSRQLVEGHENEPHFVVENFGLLRLLQDGPDLSPGTYSATISVHVQDHSSNCSNQPLRWPESDKKDVEWVCSCRCPYLKRMLSRLCCCTSLFY
jgi:hypothetical protein